MNNPLKNIDPDDINDLLNEVEKSFHIKFAEGEITQGISCGALCDHIMNKILMLKLNILTPPIWVMIGLIATFFCALVCFYFDWRIALTGLAFSLSGFWLAGKMANELSLKTVGDLAKKMARENYVQSRRDPETVNKKGSGAAIE